MNNNHHVNHNIKYRFYISNFIILKKCMIYRKIILKKCKKRVMIMYFKRKAYDKLIEWKLNYADSYAVLLEGARRVGKSTIAKLFAENEYKLYILIDFSIASTDILSCFDDINHLDMFF